MSAFLIPAASAQTPAMPLCESIASGDFAPQLKKLSGQIKKAGRVLKTLYRSSEEVTAVNYNLKKDAGGQTHSVWSVTTPQGKMALKILRHYGSEKEIKYSLVLQKFLGELGLTPRLYGIVKTHEIAELMEKFPEMNGDSLGADYSFGILMEEVEGGWNVFKSKRVPEEAPSWDWEAIVDRFKLVSRALDELRIEELDTQFLISKTGRLYLFDLDTFSWISNRNIAYGYTSTDIGTLSGILRRLNPFVKTKPVRNDLSEELRKFEELQRRFQQ